MTEAERRCELCGRSVARRTRHHLVPRTRWSGRRGQHGRKGGELRERRERIAWLCRPCHKQVHALLSEKELERSFDTLEKLAAHPEIARFVRWVRKRPGDTHVVTLRARRRGRGGKGPR